MYRACVATVAVSSREGRGYVGTDDRVRREHRIRWVIFSRGTTPCHHDVISLAV